MNNTSYGICCIFFLFFLFCIFIHEAHTYRFYILIELSGEQQKKKLYVYMEEEQNVCGVYSPTRNLSYWKKNYCKICDNVRSTCMHTHTHVHI